MAKCKNCKNYGSVFNENNEVVYKWCPKKNDSPDMELERDCEHYEPMTNADRVRSMGDKELAFILMCPYETDQDLCHKKNCYTCVLEWLQSEVEDK